MVHNHVDLVRVTLEAESWFVSTVDTLPSNNDLCVAFKLAGNVSAQNHGFEM